MKKSTLKMNILFSIISQLITYISPLIVAPYLSRILKPNGIGLYSYGYSYIFYFSNLILLGYSILGITLISKNRNDKEDYSSYCWTILFLKMIVGIIIIAVFFTLIYFGVFSKKYNLSTIMITLSIVLFSNIIDLKFLFQGLEKFKIISFLQVLLNIFFVISIFVFIKSEDDVVKYSLIKSSIDFLVNIVLLIISIKYLSKPTFLKKEAKKILVESIYLFIPGILLTAGSQIDQTIIGRYCDNSEVGYYQQAVKFPILISNITYAIAPVMLSRITFLLKNEKEEEAKTNFSNIIVLALFISLPCCFGLYAIGNIFIPFYLGEEFTPAIKILYILLPYSVVSPLSNILINAYYYPRNEKRMVLIASAIDLLINIILTFTLVKIFELGAIGASVATLVCECALLITLLIGCIKSINKKQIIIDFIKILFSSIIMCLIIVLINYFLKEHLKTIVLLLVDCIIGLVLFLILLLIFGRNILRKILFKKANIKLE